MKVNHLAKNSSVCRTHSWDVMHPEVRGYIAHWRLTLNSQLLVWSEESHSVTRHDKVMFSRNNWVSSHGAAKLVIM